MKGDGDVMRRASIVRLRMPCRLCGHTHQVHTGVALIAPPPQHADTAAAAAAHEGHERNFSSTTEVVFAALSAAEIQAYIATGKSCLTALQATMLTEAIAQMPKLNGSMRR